MPFNEIDKPLMVYTFFGKRYDIYNNVAYKTTKLQRFYGTNEISK